jgi:serine/threonine protein kinase
VERATFFDRLRQNRLLTDAELEQAASRFTNDAPVPDIAGTLVNEGVLTGFQAQHLCSNDTQPLTLGQYRILDELGRGGMGRVYKALHTIMGRVVAIKVISPELVQNPVAVEWFRREVRASTHLVHPNIVMAYDANEAEGLHFLVMEYVEGVTLDALLKQGGPLPIENACALMRQAALGLQHAHEKGRIHRDIKPGNLLIPRSDSDQPSDILVKIADFGLARLQNKNSDNTIQLRPEAGVLGTPDFISPEQSRDIHSTDIRSDLYSLGCTFYLTLAGRVPVLGETAMEKLIKHLMEEPEPLEKVRPDVPPAVVAVVKKLMAKDPANRFQTPAELARELGACLAERPKETSATPPLCRPLWIAPPTQGGGVLGAPAEPASTTRLIDAKPVFAPSRGEVELSGPSLFEPPWKYAPGDKQRQPTHDTLSGSKVEDTEVVTAEATAAVPATPSGPRVASDSTLQEVSTSAAALPAAVESAPAAPERIAPVLRPLWRRWRALLQTIVNGSGPARRCRGLPHGPHTAVVRLPGGRRDRRHARAARFLSGAGLHRPALAQPANLRPHRAGDAARPARPLPASRAGAEREQGTLDGPPVCRPDPAGAQPDRPGRLVLELRPAVAAVARAGVSVGLLQTFDALRLGLRGHAPVATHGRDFPGRHRLLDLPPGAHAAHVTACDCCGASGVA